MGTISRNGAERNGTERRSKTRNSGGTTKIAQDGLKLVAKATRLRCLPPDNQVSCSTCIIYIPFAKLRNSTLVESARTCTGEGLEGQGCMRIAALQLVGALIVHILAGRYKVNICSED